MKQNPKQYRQGDVILVQIDQPSKPGREIGPEDGQFILARGEFTGHAHRIQAYDDRIKFYQGARDRRYLFLTETTRLEHEEHGAIVLEPGWYEVCQQREYDPAETAFAND